MGKIILVTGGNRGIGKEICRQLAALGHTIILGSRRRENGLVAARNMEGDIHVQQLDVTKEEDILAINEFIGNKFGKLNVLINNAAILKGSHGVMDVRLDVVREVFDTNYFATWKLSQVLLPLLSNGKDGRIINVSSGMGAFSDLTGGYAAYRMAKSSLNALTILMANELKGSIKVNAMCPGWARTDMGGEEASRSVEKGAETAVWLATESNIPTGKFFRDKREISW